MASTFEIYAIGVVGNGLMYVRDHYAAGTKIVNTTSELLATVRTDRTAWAYTDDCEWKRRRIAKFIAVEHSASGVRLGHYTFAVADLHPLRDITLMAIEEAQSRLFEEELHKRQGQRIKALAVCEQYIKGLVDLNTTWSELRSIDEPGWDD